MEKRGLGRGLAALIPEANASSEEGQVREIPLTQIVPNPFQPRAIFDPEKMAELVDSVRAHGILQPVLLRQVGLERYELVAGERRFRAAEAAGLHTIPALIRDMSEREQLEIAIVENLQREDIGPVETARAFMRLKEEFTMTQEVISQRTGKARSTISNLLRLLMLPEDVLQSLEVGEITEGHARALLILTEDWRQSVLWSQIVQEKLNVRETEKRARKLQDEVDIRTGAIPAPRIEQKPENASPTIPALRRDPHEEKAIELIQQIVGTKVSVRKNASGGGRVEMEFYSAQELERLLELLLSLDKQKSKI